MPIVQDAKALAKEFTVYNYDRIRSIVRTESEYLTHSSTLLDITPYGRQQEWEDSPEGWPQFPTYG
ncbi:MAG: hypothetical protein R3E79_38120 [Caldilineaceae bacterium]